MNETLAAHKFLTIAAVLVAMALVLSFVSPEQTVAAVAERIGLQDRPVEVKVAEPVAKEPEVRPTAARKHVDTGRRPESESKTPPPATPVVADVKPVYRRTPSRRRKSQAASDAVRPDLAGPSVPEESRQEGDVPAPEATQLALAGLAVLKAALREETQIPREAAKPEVVETLVLKVTSREQGHLVEKHFYQDGRMKLLLDGHEAANR